MDATRDHIVEYQMHGQDIPTLLGHWADRHPDHPALVWDPVEGDGRSWTYARAARRRAPARGRPRRPRHRPGRQGAHPLRELPGDGARVAGVRHPRRGRGHHEHEVGDERDRLLREQGAVRGRDHPTAVRGDGRRGRARAPVDRGHRRRTRRGRHGSPSTICSRPSRSAWAGRADRSRCCRSGSCSRRAPRTGRRRWCTRTPTRSGRAGSGRATSTSDPTTAT